MVALMQKESVEPISFIYKEALECPTKINDAIPHT